jgi:hypothetical protein
MCGSPVCPVCGPKVWGRAREALWRAVRAWSASGGQVGLVTLTVPHRRSAGLSEVLDDLFAVWSLSASGRPWRRLVDAAGVAGWARLLEVADGARGWHPHFHVLVLLPRSTSVDAFSAFVDGWRDRWVEACRRVDRSVPLSATQVAVHGKLLDRPGRAVIDYVVKGPGPVVTELAAAVSAGDERARARWREFQAALLGRTRVVRSGGFLGCGLVVPSAQRRPPRLGLLRSRGMTVVRALRLVWPRARSPCG